MIKNMDWLYSNGLIPVIRLNDRKYIIHPKISIIYNFILFILSLYIKVIKT